MSAAMTAASAVASATAGRAAGRPRANAKVRLRPVPPDASSARRSGRTFAIRRDVWRRRARRAASTPARRPTAFPDGRDRAVTLDAREKPPLLVVPSVLRARAPARSRSPSRSAPVAVGWTSPVRRPRFARARTPLTPAPRKQAARPVRKSVATAALSEPSSAWCVSRAAAAARRIQADASAVSRLRAHTRKCRFGAASVHARRGSSRS